MSRHLPLLPYVTSRRGQDKLYLCLLHEAVLSVWSTCSSSAMTATLSKIRFCEQQIMKAVRNESCGNEHEDLKPRLRAKSKLILWKETK